MKELNIGRILTENRRRRGITQDELAEYMGVSKASVSKWETAATYPDITMLPRLATYFNISIDELIGYEPQMTREDIRRLYRKISRDFSEKPFDQVMEHCREISKKYFSCTPLLFQIGCLYVNHCALAGSPEEIMRILAEAAELFVRIREESQDAELVSQALNMEAFCLLRLGRADEVIEMLTPAIRLRMAPEPLLSSAYCMTGNAREAGRILQAGMYQTVIELLNLLLAYIPLCRENDRTFEQTFDRILELIASFRMETLHPGIILTAYISLAQESVSREENEKALDLLERYAELAASGIYPLYLHGDSYFDLLDEWLEENCALGGDLPRTQAAVQKDIVRAVTENPAFAPLGGSIRYKSILRRLEREVLS